MSTARPTYLALLLLTACGGEPAAPATDTGVPDAEPPDTGPPPCFVRAGPGEPTPDVETCGVCLEPYARIANPVDLSVGRDQHLAAVPGGLIALVGARVVFIGDDGTVVPYLERPWHEDAFFDGFELHAVPGRRQVWVISRDLGNRDDVVLLELDGSDWIRLASGSVPFLWYADAVDDGTLVGWDGGFGLARVRALPDGSIDFARVSGGTLVPGLLSAQFVDVFALPGALAAVLILTSRPPRSSWLVVTDSDLEVVRPAVELAGPDPAGLYAERPFAVGGVQRTDGTVVLLLWGSLAGMNAWPSAHNWLLRIEPDGIPREAPPGVLMNPTLFMMGEGAIWGSAGLPLIFPGGYDGLVWTLHDGRLEDGGQVLDASGTPMLMWEHEFGEVSGLTLWTVHDGGDRTYAMDHLYRYPDDVSMDGINYGVNHWNRDFERVWTRALQQCEGRVGEYGFAYAGAHDDGLWVVWEDDVPDVTGAIVAVPKVARLRSDGTWAWAGE